MSSPVQITLELTHLDPTHATYAYAHSRDYASSIVISREIYRMLGEPRTITNRMAGI